MTSVHNHAGAIYQIQVQGELDQGWRQWFNGLVITCAHASSTSSVTTLTGRVADQAALRGLLCKLWDLNLVLVSVRRTEETDKEGSEDG